MLTFCVSAFSQNYDQVKQDVLTLCKAKVLVEDLGSYIRKSTGPEIAVTVTNVSDKNIVELTRAIISCSKPVSIVLSANQDFTKIPDNSFENCDYLKYLFFDGNSGSLKEIGKNAFGNCKRLKYLEIPESVTSVAFNAFQGCVNLIVLEDGEEEISIDDYEFFYDDLHITNIKIPKGANWNGYAFEDGNLGALVIADGIASLNINQIEDCPMLSITIPESVKEITGKLTTDTKILVSDELYAKYHEQYPKMEALDARILKLVTQPGKKHITADELSGITRIPDCAFAGCSNIESIEIPESVTEIGNYAFWRCISLKSVKLPSRLTVIPRYTFKGCVSLQSISIPESVTKIGFCAFECCMGLKSVSLPQNITEIESNAFSNCKGLKSFDFPKGISKINTMIGGCPGIVSVTIPETVTEIGSYAFTGCSSLKSITIPNSVKKIESAAFYDCASLSSIVIPESVTEIREYAFWGCTSLKSVSLPNSICKIPYSTFYNCSSLESITIPSGVKEIENGAFEGCKSLASVSWPETMPYVTCNAFEGCQLLKLKPSQIPSWGKYKYKNGHLISIELPDTLTVIRGWSFENCIKLESVKFPEKVIEIGTSAFRNCPSLKSITIPESVKFIFDNAFDDDTTIYVSKEQYDDFQKWHKYPNMKVKD